MSPEQQRIAIAEVCGLDGAKDAFPDYLNDLNAMHEAEMKLIAGDLDTEYRETLDKVCGQYAIIFRATAAQRAEAFIRTLNKWEEAK